MTDILAPSLDALKINAQSLLRQAASLQSPSRWKAGIVMQAQRLLDAIAFVERDEAKIREDEKQKAEGK